MTDPRTPHKHAAVIKAWADGAEIEWKPSYSTEWVPIGQSPTWGEMLDYRVKPVPHKWQKEMDAAREGKVIQFRHGPNAAWGVWAHAKEFADQLGYWNDDSYEFRIKSEKVVRWMTLGTSTSASFRLHETPDPVGKHSMNLKLTFEDGKLIAAEVLNG